MLPETILAGVRTVTTVSEHFQELQQAALSMLQSYSASNRGYFTPSEDEQVRHLLVSYWQSRNALIELVVSFHSSSSDDAREENRLSDELRPAGFLVAYAGALVLIDAARFLRRHCDERPIVVTKLNEPEPYFGIPEGTYDKVQKSLTSPVHIWHVYHAARYFEDHQDQLRGLARGTALEPLLQIIDRLQQQIQVDVLDAAKARMKVRAQQLVSKVKRDLLSRAMYGLQKTVSRLLSEKYIRSGHTPGLPTAVYTEIAGLLQPGDVLITRKEYALTNYFLPGYWPHAAFYIGDSQHFEQVGIKDHAEVQPRWQRLLDCDALEPRRVLEALKDGVRLRSLTCPLGSDAVAVIRPRLEQGEIANAITRGIFHEGKPYDFDFDFSRSDRLVCTEVVYRAFDGVGGFSFPLTSRAGRMTLAAEDLLQMALNHNQFEPVAVYAPPHTSGLLRGDAAEKVMRETQS